MKRPAHLTLVDADRYSALVSRCTEQRVRAEKAEARIEALERDLRQTCWHTAEGNDYLYCGLCEGEVRDGADRATLDAAHDPSCSAARAAGRKP